jgi:maltose/moltooligosaccharide transporter
MLKIQEKRSNAFFAILALPATSFGFALSVQIAALSWILTTKYGLDIHDIGLVWAAGPLAGIFGQVIIGGLSDRVWLWNGRRRPFIVIGGVIAAMALLALPSLDVISAALGFDGVLGVALVVVLSLDFAVNVGFNPTRSVIADVTPSGVDRTKGYTWMQTVSGTISIGAYAIGAFYNNYVLLYIGAGLVLLLSVIPTFFIEEPRTIESDEQTDASAAPRISIVAMLQSIQPLWGFLVYDIYAMSLRIGGIEYDHYYAEIICGALTVVLVVKTLLRNDEGEATSIQRQVQFRKVLAANSFSWIGVQSMFVFMVAYVQHRLPALDDIAMGRLVSMSFLVLTVVSAILPVLVLEPISERIGRIKTHASCLAIMAVGYFAMFLVGSTPFYIYTLMVVIAIGWASMISLPFAIMSQKIDKAQTGLYMGLFNLSIVLPQLIVSLGISLALSRAEDKSIVFVIAAISIALSSISWLAVREDKDSMRGETTPDD